MPDLDPALGAPDVDNDATHGRTRVAVYVGTYKRNEPLRLLLESVVRAADEVRERATVAMIVVDDNPDGAARPVVEAFENRFEGGVHYRHVGKGNISLVRNTGLDAGLELGDWIAMTDDDCEVNPLWLAAFLDVQQRTGADALTASCKLRVPPGSASWLTDEPFLDDGQIDEADGTEMKIAATNNSMISSSWLRAHPDIRFEPELGVLGGEDMVFYGTAHRAGLQIRFAADGFVYGNESAQRSTFKYRVRSSYWLGNTICVTNLWLKSATRQRLVLRGIRMFARAIARPVTRLIRRESPQFRYAIASVAQSCGVILGALGLRRAHH